MLTVYLLAGLLVCNVGLLAIPSQALEHLMDKNEVDGGVNGHKIYSGVSVAQCFNASGSYTLTNISIYVMDQVPNDNPLTVELYDNDDSGTPFDYSDDIPGIPISPPVDSNGPNDVFAWLNFSFGAGIPLTKGTRYWIVASSADTNNKGYRWKSSNSDAYPEGYIAKTPSSAWQIVPLDDLMFRVFTEGYKPQLQNPSVSPPDGDAGEFFNFTVTYLDLDDGAPVNMNITIVGPVSMNISMQELDPSDLVYSDGKEYYYNISLPKGIYTFYFVTNDTLFWNRTQDFILTVSNIICELNSPGVSPSSGMGGQFFNFTVNYLDANDDAPNPINVVITGPLSQNITMLPVDISDNNYTDGKDYFYNISLPPGTYNYYFIANDSRDWNSSGPYVLVVINNVPQLSLPQVVPSTGFTDTDFNFTVTYTDMDNHQPDTITVNITGVGEYDLNEDDTLDTDYTDGKDYYYASAGFPIGIHDFHFAANDTFGNWTESITLQFEVVNGVPQLSFDQVNPIMGYNDTWFNFTIIYSDLDNHTPGTITVNITNFGIIDLIEADPSDMDFTDGKTFYVNLSGIPLGIAYTFHFAANDTMGDWVEGSEIDGPDVVNRGPGLFLDQVNPTTGFIDIWFNFTVVYTDLDNNAPDTISVNVTGLDVYELNEVDSLDMDYSDGKEYYYSISGIAIGQYSFHFAANDTMGFWTESGISQFEVLNREPVLSLGQVDPTTGYTDTGFNFTVTYTDLDGHAPDTLTVNITGLGVYSLAEVDSTDIDYTDGKSYYANITGIPIGSAYTFHFAANDTIGDWTLETPAIDAPDVMERTAVLTSFNVTVRFSDIAFLNATLIGNTTPITGEDIAFYIDLNDNGNYEAGEVAGMGQILAGGIVSVIYPATMVPGVYNYLTTYLGTFYSVPDSMATLTIDPKPATIMVPSRITEEGQGVTLNATLSDEDSVGVPSQIIEFYVDRNKDGTSTGSELVGSGQTDSSGHIGVFDLTITPQLATGSYAIWAKYKGSGNYSVTDGNGFLIVQNSTNNPPTIVTPVPDQIKTEDSAPWVLHLTLHGLDAEDSGENLKWYLTGVDTTIYTVTGMNSTDDVFTFVPVPDAFGNDEVTLWLVDSSGGKTFQTLWINLTPVNDRPKIEAINPLTVHFDAGYTYFFYNYVSDIEDPKEDLVLTTDDPEHTTVDGLSITFLYPGSMNGTTDNVLVTVTDTEGGSTSTIVIVRVSDDWVPELEKEIPDITLYEGETVVNAFDLDDYFSDPDGDALFYVTGQSHVTIEIDMVTHVVNITAPEDWYGSETVSFHALDPSNARVEDIILITVLPVNDEPSISDVPDLVVHFDQDYIFDLTGYIDDEDNEDSQLQLSLINPVTGLPIPGIEIDPNNNLGILINLPESLNGSQIQLQIQVSDGIDSNFTTITITVSNDFPPELISPIPDVSFEEDSILLNAFDIDNYFIDIDDTYLIYTTGHEMINVTINPDGEVTFSAPADWFGSESVTFRASDDSGALVESTITVSVIPVNDAPTIAEIPEQEGAQGVIWVLDISEYLFDIDNDIEDLTVSVDSEYVSVVGYTLIFDYPVGMKEDIVTITVSDGALETSGTFSVTVAKAETPSTGYLLLDYLFWILLIPIILAALLIGFTAYKRKVTAPFVDEVFLIADDGTLIAHNTLSLEEEIDKDILGGMLTGVKNLISDAFIADESREKGLHKLEFGEKNILLEKGNHFFIAIVFSGVENKNLLEKIQVVIKEIEEKFGDVLENWTGDMHVFIDTDEILEPLLSLEKLSEEERKKLKDARKEMKEAHELAIRELAITLVDSPTHEDLEKLLGDESPTTEPEQ
jgi:hypothetical protein